jgi:hypothetical protein
VVAVSQAPSPESRTHGPLQRSGRLVREAVLCGTSAGMSTVRAVPAPDGAWRVAGAPMTRSPMVRSVYCDGRRGVSVFETPPRSRMLAAEMMAPPSAHLPSRVGLRTVLHKLCCPTCGVAGKLVMNGSHGTRRSVRCKAVQTGGRVCGRSWTGLALAKAVDVAWNLLQDEMAAEQEGLAEVEQKEASDGSEEMEGEALVASSNPHLTQTRHPEWIAEALDTADGGLIGQIAILNDNLSRSQELLARAQNMQEELQRLLTAERQRSTQLAEALRVADSRLRANETLVTVADPPTSNVEPTAEPPVQRPSFSEIVRRQQQRHQTVQLNVSEEILRAELRRIGAIAPPSTTPLWRGVTAVYFRNLQRCPVGQLRAIIRSAVHQDAAIGISFIGRNVAEILCTKNRVPSLTRFLEAMGAKPMLDYRPDTDGTTGRGSMHEGNLSACIGRWKRELATCPPRARIWYNERIETVSPPTLHDKPTETESPVSAPHSENGSTAHDTDRDEGNALTVGLADVPKHNEMNTVDAHGNLPDPILRVDELAGHGDYLDSDQEMDIPVTPEPHDHSLSAGPVTEDLNEDVVDWSDAPCDLNSGQNQN